MGLVPAAGPGRGGSREPGSREILPGAPCPVETFARRARRPIGVRRAAHGRARALASASPRAGATSGSSPRPRRRAQRAQRPRGPGGRGGRVGVAPEARAAGSRGLPRRQAPARGAGPGPGGDGLRRFRPPPLGGARDPEGGASAGAGRGRGASSPSSSRARTPRGRGSSQEEFAALLRLRRPGDRGGRPPSGQGPGGRATVRGRPRGLGPRRRGRPPTSSPRSPRSWPISPRELRRGDRVVVLSNGGFGEIHERLLDALGAAHPAPGSAGPGCGMTFAIESAAASDKRRS